MKEKKDWEQQFHQALQTLWSAEKMLTESMPLLIEKATHLGLKKNLAFHLAETHQHKVALEMICKSLNIDPGGNYNQDMNHIIEAGKKKMNVAIPPEELDVVINAGAIEVENYEITNYGIAAKYAEQLGYKEFSSRLYLTLEEEQQAETKLNFLAKDINEKAHALVESY